MFLKKPKSPRKIIVDVDAGTDDAWALFMLLRAMDAGLCDILAITCVHGNTQIDNVVRNVFRVLQTVDKHRLIPVYRGCPQPLLVSDDPKQDFFHGKDGFCDLKFDEAVEESQLLQRKHAVTVIAELIQAHPKDIELIFLGPLTNLAVVLRMYGPEVIENIKELHVMGGNYLAIGNITKCAEFNFFADPEAAQIVLDTLTCPITILPWETCTERGLQIPMKWRLEDLAAIDNKITRLLNALDEFVYVQRQRIYFKPCDALLTAVFLCPEMIQVGSDYHATVELQGKNTRGQLVLDHLKAKQNNVRIVERVTQEMFQKLLLWTVGHQGEVAVE